MKYKYLTDLQIEYYKEDNLSDEQIAQLDKGYEYEHLYTKKYGERASIYGIMNNSPLLPVFSDGTYARIFISNFIYKKKKYKEINKLYPIPLIEYVRNDGIIEYDLVSFNNLYIYAIENNMKIEDFFPIPKKRKNEEEEFFKTGKLPKVY